MISAKVQMNKYIACIEITEHINSHVKVCLTFMNSSYTYTCFWPISLYNNPIFNRNSLRASVFEMLLRNQPSCMVQISRLNCILGTQCFNYKVFWRISNSWKDLHYYWSRLMNYLLIINCYEFVRCSNEVKEDWLDLIFIKTCLQLNRLKIRK